MDTQGLVESHHDRDAADVITVAFQPAYHYKVFSIILTGIGRLRTDDFRIDSMIKQSTAQLYILLYLNTIQLCAHICILQNSVKIPLWWSTSIITKNDLTF